MRGSVRNVRRAGGRLVFTMLAIGLVTLVVTSSAQAAGTGSIAGDVEQGANFVGNYEVDLFGSSLTEIDSVCTTLGGTYEFDGLGTGQYYVYFRGGAGGSFHAGACTADTSASGWWPGDAFPPAHPSTFSLAQPVSVTDGVATTGIGVQLEPGRTISGTAKDSVSANGIPNIDVKILDIPGGNLVASRCTAANGGYSIGKLVGTLYNVEFVDDGACPAAPPNPYKIQYYNGAATIAAAEQIDTSTSDKSGIDASLVQGVNHLLVVTTNGSGSGSVVSSDGVAIHCPTGACQNVFDDGTVVTLTATPSPGSVFAGWINGDCSGQSSICTLTMDADKSAEAIFAPAPPKHSLTVSPSGSGSGSVTSSVGGISCPGTCSANLDEGSTVTLTAAPASGSTFAGWSGGGCSGTGSCQVTLNADTSVTATFNSAGGGPTTASLSVKTAGTGSGHVTSSAGGISCPGTCSAPLALGSKVTLTATPSAGSTFAGWSGGGCSGTGTCEMTLNAASTVTATFTVDSGAPPPKLSCSLGVLSTHVASGAPKPRSGRLTLKISCDQAAAATVTGVITERLKKHKTKAFRLRTIHISAAAGRENTAVVKLPSGAIKGLRQHRHETVTFTLVASNAGGTTRVSAKVGRLKL